MRQVFLVSVGGWVMFMSTSHNGALGEKVNRVCIMKRRAWWMCAFYLLVYSRLDHHVLCRNKSQDYQQDLSP